MLTTIDEIFDSVSITNLTAGVYTSGAGGAGGALSDAVAARHKTKTRRQSLANLFYTTSRLVRSVFPTASSREARAIRYQEQYNPSLNGITKHQVQHSKWTEVYMQQLQQQAIANNNTQAALDANREHASPSPTHSVASPTSANSARKHVSFAAESTAASPAVKPGGSRRDRTLKRLASNNATTATSNSHRRSLAMRLLHNHTERVEQGTNKLR